MKKFLATTLLLFFVAVPVFQPTVNAQNLICTVFPFLENVGAFGISDICTGALNNDAPINNARSLIQTGLSLVFIGIIVLAIYIIIKAAINYIRSEGDQDKVQAAQKSIKSVFVGIIALFVGIIGIILVLAIFNATGAVQHEELPPGVLD